jgi:hypothetical protein
MTRLREHDWQDSFTSSQNNLLLGFYQPVLQQAIRYWRITGYFSSRSLLQVLDGVEQLVLAAPDGHGHGQMRLITGFFLSPADLQALATGFTPAQLLEQQLSARFPFKEVQPGDGSATDLAAELLAWLVQHGHLEIRVGLPLRDGQISGDGALFHAKEGVVEDRHGDRLAFSGSINETPNGWSTNDKSFDVFCSWRGEERRVEAKERHFLRLWQNEDPGVRTLKWQATCLRPKVESRPVDRSSWTAEPYVLVSSHLMRRRERQGGLPQAEPYDLVVRDEAHHARTRRENRGSGGERLRPNTLMQLMRQLRSRTQGLLLLTATPMQVSELEVWELLALLGLPPEWSEDAFERFLEWVEKWNPDEATLSYLAGLWRSRVRAFGEAPANALPEDLRKSPLRRREALRALNDTDPLSRRNLSIEIR